ncbi:MAG: hypothetical protein QW279_10025, partial [Candidatus Jordarchaeaceae archaeon]
NSYWGDTFKLGRLIPSNTDLSYIVLFVNENFEVKVASESGQIVDEGFYFQEGPMLDPEEPNSVSGVEILNAFYYPKPESGVYEIIISGNGVYQADYFLYDPEGNVKTGSIFGSVSDSEPDTFSINLDKDNLDLSEAPPVNFESLLSYWDDIYKDGHISNHGLYTSVKKLIENASKNEGKDKNISTRILLEIALERVKFSTPTYIDPIASEYMQRQIKIILKSI